MKFFRKRKWTRNRLKCLRIHHLHFFSKKIPGRSKHVAKRYSLTHHHTTASPRGREVGLQPPPVVDLLCSFWIRHWQCNVIQLSWSEFKRLYLHSRLHHFASFIQNFLGGAPPPPEPPPTGGDTPPVPSPLGPSGLEKPPPPGWVLDPPLRLKIWLLAVIKYLL